MNQKTMIPERVFFRIGDVAAILGVKPYVIRFWEGEFPFVAPEKSSTGQRVYRRAQIEGLVLIKHLLHGERYSIEGAKKRLTELRKQSKLKETMLELIQGGDAAQEKVKVGDLLSKDQVASLKEIKDLKEIRDRISELQTLIRQPEVSGLDVPKLIDVSKKD